MSKNGDATKGKADVSPARNGGDEAEKVDHSRRDLLKAVGLASVAVIAPAALPLGGRKILSQPGGTGQNVTVLKGKTAADLYPVKSDFKRFDVRKTSFNRSATDPTSDAYQAVAKMPLVEQQRVRNGEVGFKLQDYALASAAATVQTYSGVGTGTRDTGLYSWSSLGAAKLPYNVQKLYTGPDEMATIMKKAAISLGASLVGLCKLDQRWVYANDTVGRPIVFEDVASPYTTDDKVVIPNSFQSVVVLAIKMDYNLMTYAPYAEEAAGVSLGYDNMPIIAARVAEFIRGLGWQAIPMGNDTTQSIPMAIDAGLGRLGRICRLVTPEYGPNVRLMKVLTDLKMTYDSPIEFGLEEFCNNCKKCVKACPAQALPYIDQQWQGTTPSEVTGVYKWQQLSDKCLRWWGQVGTGCGICIRVCPWSAGITHVSDSAKYLVKNVPSLDATLKSLDDDLGNGILQDPAKFWKE